MPQQSLFDKIEALPTDSRAAALVILNDKAVSNVSAVQRLSSFVATSEAAVRRFRNDRGVRPDTTVRPEKGNGADEGTRVVEDQQGITVYVDKWPVELGEDLSPLVVFFGYDPEFFEVVDDTVRMSKWQQSKGRDDGGRDIVWLYSYKARFQRKQESLGTVPDLDGLLTRLETFKPRRAPSVRLQGDPVVYVHQQGDEQIGKAEGGGLEGVINRASDSVQRSVDRLSYLIAKGAQVKAIHDIANGDTIENIFGHYPSQQRTTSTLRKQMAVGRSLDLMRTKAFAEFGLPIHKTYTTDNHGEMRQKIGMAPFTSESDNLALILAESVKDVLDQCSFGEQIEWHIPHDQWWTLVTVAGVNFAVGHGHKAVGVLEKWVKNQRDMLLMHQDFRPHLINLGHKHHFLVQDVSGSTLIQTPSLDGGSPFFAALQGNVSSSGVVTYLAGTQFNQHFTDLVVL